MSEQVASPSSEQASSPTTQPPSPTAGTAASPAASTDTTDTGKTKAVARYATEADVLALMTNDKFKKFCKKKCGECGCVAFKRFAKMSPLVVRARVGSLWCQKCGRLLCEAHRNQHSCEMELEELERRRRVDVDAPSSLQLLQFHLAAVLVPVGLAQQSAALLAPQGTDSRPHDEGRHLGEALEGDAAALAALLLAELLELIICHERQDVGLGRVARDRLGLASICGIRTGGGARCGASSGTRRLCRRARRLLGARAGNLLRHWGW